MTSVSCAGGVGWRCGDLCETVCVCVCVCVCVTPKYFNQGSNSEIQHIYFLQSLAKPCVVWTINEGWRLLMSMLDLLPLPLMREPVFAPALSRA